MVRPREFEESEVREAIMRVFWEKGYESTSMQDLVDATGLLKGSLYGAFGDKAAMYLTALAHYDETQIQRAIDMLRGPGNLRGKISSLFDSVLASIKTGVFAGGCLLCNAGIEMAAVNKDVQKAVQIQIRRLHKAINKAIEFEFGNKMNSDLSGFIISNYFGTRVLAKAGMPISMIKAVRDQCLNCLPRSK